MHYTILLRARSILESGSLLYNTHMGYKTKFQISITTGSLCMLLAGAVALQIVLPKIHNFTAESTPIHAVVAGTAIGGTVEATPTNTLYEQLKLQEQALNAQNQALDAERRYLENKDRNKSLILYVIIGLLSLLVCLNFYLDIKRGKQNQQKLNPAS